MSKEKMVKALVFVKDGSACGWVEYEISKAILDKHGKELSRSVPDYFYVLMMNVENKLREIFGI